MLDAIPRIATITIAPSGNNASVSALATWLERGP